MSRAFRLSMAIAYLVLAGFVTSENVSHENVPSEDAADTNYQLGVQYYGNDNYELSRDCVDSGEARLILQQGGQGL